MRRPQLSMRTSMALIALSALACWGWSAWKRTDDLPFRFRQHFHYLVNDLKSHPRGTTIVTMETTPVWSIYWRAFLGKPRSWHYRCQPADGPKEIACTVDHPEIHRLTGGPREESETDWSVVRAIREGRVTTG